MSDASGKISLLLTATQVDLLGEALVELIPQVAERVSESTKTRTTREEASLLHAYLELAKMIIDPNDVPAPERPPYAFSPAGGDVMDPASSVRG